MKHSELGIQSPDLNYLIQVALGEVTSKEAILMTGLSDAELSCLRYDYLTVKIHLDKETKSLPFSKRVRASIVDYCLTRFSYTSLLKELAEIGYTDVLFKNSLKFAMHLHRDILSLCKKWSIAYYSQIDEQINDLSPSMRIE